MPLTGTVDAANAAIHLHVDYTTEAGSQTTATLARHVDAVDAPGEYVRGLFNADLLGEEAFVTDTEMPLDRQIWYTVSATPDNVEMTAGPFTVASDGFVWLKDPGRPWADLKLDLCNTPTLSEADPECADPLEIVLSWVGFGDVVRPADSATFPTLNRETPNAVYARRKDLNTSMQFLSRTLDGITQVYELFTAGGPLLIQTPEIYGMVPYDYPLKLSDLYFLPGDLNEEKISRDQRKPWRLWSTELLSVLNPVGVPQGTDEANWCAIEETYDTFEDLTLTGYSWEAVATGEASSGPPASGLYGGGLYGDGLYGG